MRKDTGRTPESTLARCNILPIARDSMFPRGFGVGRFATPPCADCNQDGHFVAAGIRAVVPLQLCPAGENPQFFHPFLRRFATNSGNRTLSGPMPACRREIRTLRVGQSKL